MSCKRWQRLTALHVGGDLDERGSLELQTHLKGCPSCRGLEQELRHDLEGLRSLDALARNDQSLSSVRGEVLQAVAEGEQRTRVFQPRFAMVAAVAAAALILAVWLSPRGVEHEPREVRHTVTAPTEIPVSTPLPTAPPESPTVVVQAPPEEKPHQAGPLVMAHNDLPSQPRSVESRPSVPAEPMTIKILTNDPEVVIYWIVDPKGDNENA